MVHGVHDTAQSSLEGPLKEFSVDNSTQRIRLKIYSDSDPSLIIHATNSLWVERLEFWLLLWLHVTCM